MDQLNITDKPSLRACIVGAFLFSVPAFAYSESLGLLIIPQIIGGLLVAYAVLDILKTQIVKIPLEILLYGLLGLWVALTFTFAVSTGRTETLRLGSLIKVVVVTLACAQLIKNETDLFTALKIFVFSILLVFYLNKDDFVLLRTTDQITEDDRFAGTFTNANFAAMFSLTVIWASVFLLLHSKKRFFRKALYLIPICLSSLMIYFSGSKKGLIGIGLFVLFFTRLLYIRQSSSYRKGLIILVSLSLIVITGYFILTSPFFFRVEQFLAGESSGDSRRFELVGEAINVWLTNWKTFIMGVGYENFSLFSRYQSYAHSTPFELLASNGIIACALFLSFLFLLFRKFFFLYRRTTDKELKSTFFSILIFVFLYSFFMLAEVMSDYREILPILGIVAAYGQYQLLQQEIRTKDVSVSTL